MRLLIVGSVILDWRKFMSLFMFLTFLDLLLVAHILDELVGCQLWRELGRSLSRYFHTGAGWGLDWS